MDRNIKNKIVVITGAVQNIGYAIADEYLGKGAKVVIIVDIHANQGALAVDNLNSKHGNNRAEFIKGDVTSDLEAVSSKIFSKYNTIDVLVNNAAILSENNIRKTIEINVIAVMEWSLKFFEHMRTNRGGKGGTIVNLSSIYGFRIDPFIPFYQGSKFAVLGFTRSFGHQYRFGRYGVRVVALCPGVTNTEMATGVKMTDEKIQKDFEVMLSALPIQQVKDVGKAAVDVFAKADTGTAWMIDGGQPIVDVSSFSTIW